MWIDEETVIEFAIPSWHINAHGTDCRADFGLSYRDGVGRTCGEEVEVPGLGPIHWVQVLGRWVQVHDMKP